MDSLYIRSKNRIRNKKKLNYIWKTIYLMKKGTGKNKLCTTSGRLHQQHETHKKKNTTHYRRSIPAVRSILLCAYMKRHDYPEEFKTNRKQHRRTISKKKK